MRIYALWEKNVSLFLLILSLNLVPVGINIVRYSECNASQDHSLLLEVFFQSPGPVRNGIFFLTMRRGRRGSLNECGSEVSFIQILSAVPVVNFLLLAVS